MEKYAPNKMELASRDVVSRAEQTEIDEGRGFPDGTVALDITVVPRKRIHEALREIVNVGRDFAGVDITREPIHIKPGNHYVMGGVKTDIDGQTDDPRPLRRRRVRLRVGARRQPPGRQLAARHAHLRPPLGRARRRGRARACRCPSPPHAQLARRGAAASPRSSTATGSGRRVSEIKAELGADDGQVRGGLPRRGAAAHGARGRAAAQGGGQDRGGGRQGHGLQPGRARRARAAVHARQRRGDRAVARSSARRAAAPSTAPTSRSATTRSGSSTSTSRRTASEPEISYSEVTMTQWEPRRGRTRWPTTR